MFARLTARLAAVFLMASFAQVASASTKTFTLDQDACTGGCGPAPYGTITLTEISAFQVDVMLTLVSPIKFVNTGAGSSLAFSFTPGIGISLSNMTSGFAQDLAPKGIANSGFTYGVECTVCGSGASNPNPGPLVFRVTSAVAISVTNFIANASGYFFSADVLGSTGNTGNVGTKAGQLDVVKTPEPASLAVLGTGLVAFFAARRRRRK